MQKHFEDMLPGVLARSYNVTSFCNSNGGGKGRVWYMATNRGAFQKMLKGTSQYNGAWDAMRGGARGQRVNIKE